MGRGQPAPPRRAGWLRARAGVLGRVGGPAVGGGARGVRRLGAGGWGRTGAAVAREVALLHGLELGRPKDRESEDLCVNIRSFSFQDASPCQRGETRDGRDLTSNERELQGTGALVGVRGRQAGSRGGRLRDLENRIEVYRAGMTGRRIKAKAQRQVPR